MSIGDCLGHVSRQFEINTSEDNTAFLHRVSRSMGTDSVKWRKTEEAES